MPRIYLSDVTCPPGLAEDLAKHGFEVRAGTPSGEPGPDDLFLVPARTGITSDLRHALNNPLTAVIGFSQLLARRRDLPPDVADKIRKIQTHAERVRSLIRKVGDFGA